MARKLFDLTINNAPNESTARLAFGTATSAAENITIANFFVLVKNWFLANVLTNYLAKDNTTAFTPDADYEPATKKYVDDLLASDSGELDAINVSSDLNPTTTEIKVRQIGDVVYLRMELVESGNISPGETLFSLPTTIDAPTVDTPIFIGDPSARHITAKISAGTKDIKVIEENSDTGNKMLNSVAFPVN